ncbi:Asparagine synthetase [glutamine-hydrolyzing] [hydrothermal vent metagenome]|uniref:Asparagine synthetase [glutamine-hydrolyzing] n=1 Tax=hydrothermal vent metagenome TaxID=652676 RepID=A0A3B1D4T7_9ZZZZ
MCGITGFIKPGASETRESLQRISAGMANTLHTRGPDDSGTWVDESRGVALGHRRLSIIDLSPHGRQPMVSASGRYVIAYNGEVYNFPQIKKALDKIKKINWRGHSDTEVILAAIEHYGIKEAVTQCNGMFAFALWDREERSITFARDRLGKKPLYYGWSHGALIFGSELKALMAYPGFDGEINRNALALFLRYNCVPAPYSIYKNIHKLKQGLLLTIKSPFTPGLLPEPEPYWSARDVYNRGVSDEMEADEGEIESGLNDLLLDAVGMRMISDVPLGAFLSGGIDSSLVVALMQAQSRKPVKTFTIGFHEKEYNEARHAKKVARHLGTDHTELYVTTKEAMEIIPDLPTIYDEPFADSSQIPTFLVSRMSKEHVTVCLSGDGGDESFGGYNRYLWAMSIWNKIGKIPMPGRRLGAGILTSISPPVWNKIYNIVEPMIPKRSRVANPGDKTQKLAEILVQQNPMEIYHWLVSHFKRPEDIALGSKEPITPLSDESMWATVDNFNTQMMYLDTITYLPDDILTKVDRASMGVSLEVRAPLLDYRVIEFAARLPPGLKIRGKEGKWILRKILDRYVPRKIIERPKMGFGVPIDHWLRGDLRGWCEDLLSEERLEREGYFDPAPIRQKWIEHLSGKRNWQYYLWNILMFQAWLDKVHRHG